MRCVPVISLHKRGLMRINVRVEVCCIEIHGLE